MPPISLTWTVAISDYCVSTGVRGTYANLAYSGNAGGNRHGALQPLAAPISDSRDSRLANMKDGTSNTIMIGVRLGGADIYQRRQAVNLGPLNGANGGGWADFLNGEHWLAGALYDGTLGPDGGPCAINCENLTYHGMYSFHPGGVNMLLCDGSVHFISESADPFIVCSLFTRSNQEAFSMP